MKAKITHLLRSEFVSELPADDVRFVEAESVVANSAPRSVDLNLDDIGLSLGGQSDCYGKRILNSDAKHLLHHL